MITPTFTWDASANAFLTEDIAISTKVIVRIVLAARAPVVILKREQDGEYVNYGQTAKSDTAFNIKITTKESIIIKLATPEQVSQCNILTEEEYETPV